MNIKPGTRVRSTEFGDVGVYTGRGEIYHFIQWESSADGEIDYHTEGEFEVIDE